MNSLRKSNGVNNLKVLSFKKKIFIGFGVIGILGIGYNAYHWFDGLTQSRIAYFYLEYGLPYIYTDRVALHKDIPRGIWWLTKAAERGNANAQSNLGVYLMHGNGVKKNEKEGIKWLRESADKACAEGQYNLGTCIYNGEGTLVNKQEAFRLIKDACEKMLKRGKKKGIAKNAYYVLGQFYSLGEGCEVNKKEAIIWLSRAADLGNVDARTALDNLFGSRVQIPAAR